MSLLNYTGFRTGNLNEAKGTGGSVSVQAVTVRPGEEYALKINHGGTGASHYYWFVGLDSAGVPAYFAETTLYITFYFRYAVKPVTAGQSEAIVASRFGTSTTKVELRLDTDGNLNLYRAGDLLRESGTTVLNANTWYFIELKVGTGNPGPYELKINGVIEYSGTINVSTSNNDGVFVGCPDRRSTDPVEFYYADIACDDAAYPGAGRCVRKDVVGNGFYTAWTGTYADVDEVPHDSDTSYISNATSGDAETVTLESFAAAGGVGTPLSVKTCAIVRDETVVSAVQVRLRSGSTDDDTTSNDPGATYVLRAKIYNTDPDTLLDWTVAGVDAAQVGVENNAAVALRCTALSVMVWEDGVAVASPAAGLSGLSGLSGLRGIC